MYTICWTTDDGEDRWDRESSREEVMEYLRKNELIGNGDVLIFGPEADDCLVDIEDLLE